MWEFLKLQKGFLLAAHPTKGSPFSKRPPYYCSIVIPCEFTGGPESARGEIGTCNFGPVVLNQSAVPITPLPPHKKQTTKTHTQKTKTTSYPADWPEQAKNKFVGLPLKFSSPGTGGCASGLYFCGQVPWLQESNADGQTPLRTKP